MTDAAGATAPRNWGRVLVRLMGVVLLGALVAAGLIVSFPPTGLLKDQLARDISAMTGRSVTLGNAKVDYDWPPQLMASFDGLTISNPSGMPAGRILSAREVSTKVELLPLLKGRIKMTALGFVEPRLELEEASDGARNWIFAAPAQPAASATPATPANSTLELPPHIVVEEASVSFLSAKTGASYLVQDINVVVGLDAPSSAATVKGTILANAERLTVNATLADYIAAASGRSSGFKVTIDGRPLKANLAGDIVLTSAAELTGDLEASTGSLLDLMKWAGASVTPSGDPLKSSLAGKVKATTRDVTFAATDIMINGTSSRLDGRLDLAGVRPKLEGELSSERLDLARILGQRRPGLALESINPSAAPDTAASDEPLEVQPAWDGLLEDLEALEAEGGAAAANAAPLALERAAPSAAAWSEQPFKLDALRALDLDLSITAKEVGYGTLDLKNARLKAAIDDGSLVAKLDDVDIGGGKATGTLGIDSRATPPEATLALAMKDVATEPLMVEFAGKPLLSGTSTVDLAAKAKGQNPSQLAATLDGKAHVVMAKGVLRGFDIRRIVSEWWRKWPFDLAMKTTFETLDARYDIKKGVIKSEPGLALGGNEVMISSVGDVDVPLRRIDQDVRIKVVPPTSFSIPVRINGPWTKPTVGFDWGGLFAAPVRRAAPSALPESAASASAGDVAGPQQLVAAPEPPPPAVERAIRRVLGANLPPDRLSEAGKQMLQTLLPQQTTQ